MSSPPSKQAPPIHWILWGAFTFAVFLYGGVGFYLRSQAEPPEGVDPAVLALLGVGLGAGMTASLIITLGTPLAAPRIGNWQTWLIMRLALAEIPAIMGFAAFFMGGTSVGFLALLIWSFGLMMLCMPTSRDREVWDRALPASQRRPPPRR
jgi:hypothetical protein